MMITTTRRMMMMTTMTMKGLGAPGVSRLACGGPWEAKSPHALSSPRLVLEGPPEEAGPLRCRTRNSRRFWVRSACFARPALLPRPPLSLSMRPKRSRSLRKQALCSALTRCASCSPSARNRKPRATALQRATTADFLPCRGWPKTCCRPCWFR